MKIVVVKIGTSSLICADKKLNQKKMIDFVRQINALREQGYQVILVTSGAIAAGREKMVSQSESIVNKQMLASVGQVALMRIWDRLFTIFDVLVGQLLLTKEDFIHPERAEHATNTLTALLAHGALPVINENDSVAIDEIKVGDNDNLSAYVARLMKAHLLIILTDQQGLYTADPRYHPEAKLIESIKLVGDEPLPFAGGSTQGVGTGGMVTKIEAARTATKTGTKTIIASSAMPDVLVKLLSGENIGTHFIL